MKSASLALVIALSGLSAIPNSSQAAPIVPLAAAARQGHATAMPVSWVSGSGHNQHGRTGYRHGNGIFAKLGRFRSLLGGLASGQGGGGFTSMLGGMGSGSGIASMLGGFGGGSGSDGGLASMLGSFGGGGGGFGSMLGAAAGSDTGQAAAGGEVSQSARQACTPDALRLCSDYIPDVGRITACMKAKYAQLSTPCRAAMDREGAGRSRFTARGTGGGQDTANLGGTNSTGNFSTPQNSGGFEAGRGYDRSGSGFAGGLNIGQMMGLARSFGFDWGGGW